MMKIANYTQFYRDLKAKGISYALAHSEVLGFDAVEFFSSPDYDLTRILSMEETVKLLSDYNLTVACYSTAENLFDGDLAATRERIDRSIEFAAAIGSPFIHHTLYKELSLTENSPSFKEMLKGCLPLAEHIAARCREYGITCLYEPQGMYFNGTYGLGELLSAMKAGHDNIGICADSGNSYFVDVDPVTVFKTFADDIKHVHIKDYGYNDLLISANEQYISRGGKRIVAAQLGEGSVDFIALFDILHSVSYNGTVSLEFDGSDAELKAAIDKIHSLSKTE